MLAFLLNLMMTLLAMMSLLMMLLIPVTFLIQQPQQLHPLWWTLTWMHSWKTFTLSQWNPQFVWNSIKPTSQVKVCSDVDLGPDLLCVGAGLGGGFKTQ